MGSSHGCTGDAVGGRVSTDPRGQDTDTGGENVDAWAVVGEGSSPEGGVGRSDSDGVGCVGRGLAGDRERVAKVVSVSGSDNGDDTLGVSGLNSVGPGGRGLATERQVDGGYTGPVLRPG